MNGGNGRSGLSRRELLSRGSQLVVAGAAISAAGPLAAGTPARAATPNWAGLRRRLKGRLLRPGDPGYAAASAAENYRYANVLPAGIAMCAGPGDVRTSVRWAQDNGVPLVARSGGHSYAGYSRTTGLLVDLNSMKSATFEPRSQTLRVTGAARFHDIDAALRPYNMFIPAGQCPPVSINGFTLGGGFGFYSRAHGMAVDHLVSTDVVLASGEIVSASRTEHPDLFWACRGGGGGNFGINTSMSFSLFPVDRVSVCTCEWTTRADLVLREFQNLFVTAPAAFSLIVRITPPADRGRGGPMVTAIGHYFGPRYQLREILDTVLSVAPASKTQFLDLDFWSARQYLAESPGPPHSYVERSRYVAEPMTEAGVATVVDWANRWPGGSSSSVEGRLDYYLWGGAMNAKPPAATAFVHRNDVSLFSMSASWPPAAPPRRVRPLIDWVNGTWAALGPFTTDFAYQNFTDPALTDWQHAYYGANLKRLKHVKRAYDPDDLFQFPQSIPT
jgi:FAD binding domain/Berberine and berberine like